MRLCLNHTLWLLFLVIVPFHCASSNLTMPRISKINPTPEEGVVSFKKTIQTFWEQAQFLPFEQQIRLWDRLVEPAHPIFFDSVVNNKDELGAKWLSEKQKRLAKSFHLLSKHYPEIIHLFERFETDIPIYQQAFKKHFPRAQFKHPIYLTLGGGFDGIVFDGMVSNTGTHKQTVLGFSLEQVFLYQDVPSILFAHEFFHLYHDDNTPQNTKEQDAALKITHQLWVEGLATYVSSVLNPTQPFGAILLSKELAALRSFEHQWLIQRFLQDAMEPLGSNKSEQWFRGKPKERLRPDLPARCGYLVGFLVAQELAKKHTLEELSSWSTQKAHQEVLQTLQRLSITKADSF